MTIKEITDIYDIGESALRKHIVSGEISHVKIKGKYHCDKESATAFLDAFMRKKYPCIDVGGEYKWKFKNETDE